MLRRWRQSYGDAGKCKKVETPCQTSTATGPGPSADDARIDRHHARRSLLPMPSTECGRLCIRQPASPRHGAADDPVRLVRAGWLGIDAAKRWKTGFAAQALLMVPSRGQQRGRIVNFHAKVWHGTGQPAWVSGSRSFRNAAIPTPSVERDAPGSGVLVGPPPLVHPEGLATGSRRPGSGQCGAEVPVARALRPERSAGSP